MKKAGIIKYLLLCMLAVLLMGITACKETGEKKHYEIYYSNSNGNKLAKKDYESEQTDTLELINELISQMNVNQKDNEYIVIKPEYLSIDKVDLSDKEAVIYFNEAYYDMKASTEVLLRSAIVQTLCQIDGVDEVLFMVAEQPAVYPDGTAIGVMNIDSFSDDTDEKIGRIEWRTITLYYANKAGDRLVKDEVPVAYNKNISLEKIVVEKLINGPVNAGTYATLPSDMHLLNISVNNNICYVNLSSEFSTEMVNVSAMLPVYSVVNSLCELDTIEGVKILINGNSTKAFRESINLDTVFYFNDTLIQ
ncbi:MAG: GerMN domain-containing protein [Eubacteriales bacterium]|nr:GerMN domain-containing protein [Eubacteriales bacterium]